MIETKIVLAYVPHPGRPGTGLLSLNRHWRSCQLQTVDQKVERQAQILMKWPRCGSQKPGVYDRKVLMSFLLLLLVTFCQRVHNICVATDKMFVKKSHFEKNHRLVTFWWCCSSLRFFNSGFIDGYRLGLNDVFRVFHTSCKETAFIQGEGNTRFGNPGQYQVHTHQMTVQ